MTKAEIILEKKHAKYMVDFLKIYKHTSHEKYNIWVNRYDRLKHLCKK